MSKKKYIKTPEFMWELFEGYVKEVKSNPILQHDFVGGQGKEITRKHEKPLTMVGFENYVFRQGYNTELSNYFGNTNEKYTDYSAICSRIRAEIREDQISGGMAGIYNPSITQRLNGLTDKKEVDTKGDITISFE